MDFSSHIQYYLVKRVLSAKQGMLEEIQDKKIYTSWMGTAKTAAISTAY